MPHGWPSSRNLPECYEIAFIVCTNASFDQEFYKEKVSWKALREERFLAMADKEGLSRKKAQAKLDSQKARTLVSN